MTPVWLFGAAALTSWVLWIAVNDLLSGARTGPEIYDRARLKLRTLSACDAAWARSPRRADIIVCLTTIPSRLPHLELTLKSLLCQTLPPQRIHLHLPAFSQREQRGYAVPAAWRELRALKIVEGGPDYGPATKLIPAVRALPPDQKILAVDDDRLYPPAFVEDFQRWSEAHPDWAIGAAGWVVPADLTDRHLNFWNNLWQRPPIPLKSTRLRAPRRVHILEGYAGYLVKPRFFDYARLVDYAGAPPAAFFVDDVWMSARCRAPRYVFPARRHAFNRWRRAVFDRTALWRINGQSDPERRNNTIMIRHLRACWESLDGAG